MCRRYVTLLCLFSLFASIVAAQGLTTTASKDDWEEINFEFNSPILTDGYPSLLRLAELLNRNPGYKVKVEGHADWVGSNRYNDRLGQRRAEAVKAFLVKYGAREDQITVTSFGEREPKVPNQSKEGRFMNRRVVLTVTDPQGRIISAGGVGDAIEALQKGLKDLADAQKKCCDDILKRLDKLDEIADMLRKLAGENDALRKEIADVRKAQADLESFVKGQPKPLTAAETASIVDTRTAEQIERARMPRYSISGLNVGADQDGKLTFTGRGRLFMPFKEQFAVQMQGEYMYFRDRKEGQADVGLVHRFATRAQAGVFGSFKHVSFTPRGSLRDPFAPPPALQGQLPLSTVELLSQPFSNIQFDPGQARGSGTIGQASATLDYIFSRGRVGIFGAKGFLNNAIIDRIAISRNVFTEVLLRTIDQVGASTILGLVGNTYVEGNLGYLKSAANADRMGGTARFVLPISDRFAFTIEGGMNETFISRGNNGRVVFGFQFGNFMRPKDYLEGYNGIQHAVPADVPRVRYELLTRRVRTGNDAPVCVLTPDQVGVEAGPVTLDAAGTFDPEGDAITFQWAQVGGPAVSITGMNTATARFTAAEGQTYVFQLTARDPSGAQCVARSSVTTAVPEPVTVARFTASPDRIRAGEASNLDWQVLNADRVEIQPGLGTVPANGTRTVRPPRTTTYTLRARGPGGEATATVTVVVEERVEPTIVACQVSPMNIVAGESATVFVSTLGAEQVEVTPGVGPVARSGSFTVSPAETTTYTVTATNPAGQVSCQITVQVTPGTAPRIVTFAGNPATIDRGQSTTLTWSVENADTVTISGGIGTVAASGSRQVSPTETTTYTLTARNRFGEVSGTSTITVNVPPPPPPAGQAPTLTDCRADPGTSPRPGDAVRLFFTAANAQTISISSGVGTVTASPVTVNPLANTAYTVTATGAGGQTAACTINVTVTPAAPPPVAIISGPSTIETLDRLLTIDGSQSVNPAGGALTFIWEPLSTGAAVLDQGQAQTRVQIGGLFGDYIFRLTVRNAAGQTDSTTVTVRFRSTTVF